ncbi:MAG: hypothetical protein ACI85B_002453 [Flavobacteriaceae bacterium]|jgi:hypothetical protein
MVYMALQDIVERMFNFLKEEESQSPVFRI